MLLRLIFLLQDEFFYGNVSRIELVINLQSDTSIIKNKIINFLFLDIKKKLD